MKTVPYIVIIFAVIIAVSFTYAVSAEESAPTEAEELPLTVTGAGGVSKLTDGKENTYTEYSDSVTLTLSAELGIDSLYVVFDRIPGEWSLSDGVDTVVCGEDSFLHEYLDVNSLFGYSPTTLQLIFEDGASLSELHAFTDGDTPSWVQVWQPPCERVDLMLCSTHSDDEQLFFAGILPYFAGELRLNVQVVYFTSPYKYHERPHEQLNGLWEVGVRNYPVFGQYVDAYSETLKDAYAHQKAYGFSRDHMVAFQVEMLRRFRPLVVIGHDFNGEYSHGQHMINTDTLVEALNLAADAGNYPESADKYGAWDTPKTYIHLYEENPIVMDWDTPLQSFGGKTAFEVTQDGFSHHTSQHWTWFNRWIYGKSDSPVLKATDIKKYSPCLYGLYRTTVGLDSGIGDMFENVMTYAEQDEEERRREEESRAAESESLRLEEESRAAESESLRLEEESRAAESESLRLEEESRAAESESLRLEEEERTADEAAAARRRMIIAVVIAVALAAVITVAASAKVSVCRQKKKLKHRRKPRI